MRLLGRLFHRKLSKKRFVKRMLRALSEAGATDLRYDDAEFSITIGERGHRAYLSNAFAACREADEATRRETILNHVAAALHTPPVPVSFESVKSNLLPIIRDPAYHGLFRLKLLLDRKTTDNLEIASRPLTEGLNISLAHDSERSMSFVNVGMLKGWGVSLDQALKVAKNNLRDRTDTNGWVQQSPGLFLGSWNDAYDSSRMLLTEHIYRLPLNGDPVLFAPNRDTIWITGTSDFAGVEYILRAGKESHFKESHPLSPNLYRLADGDWTPYIPLEQVLRELLTSIQRDRNAVDYQQQKQDLDALHEKNQTDIFVASYSMFERQFKEKPGKSRFSLCVWSRGVESLLPKTEKIAFLVDPETKDYISVRWESAIHIVGHLMKQDPDLLPLRYWVRAFPNESQIAQLRQLAAVQSDEF